MSSVKSSNPHAWEHIGTLSQRLERRKEGRKEAVRNGREIQYSTVQYSNVSKRGNMGH